MSIEQVKEIIRKPWRSTSIEENPSKVPLTETSWASIDVPVELTSRSASGLAATYAARTLLVSRNAAKLECVPGDGGGLKQHPFSLHQILWIEVPSTGKAGAGKVVWTDTRPNADGRFELAIELEGSHKLFDIPDCGPNGTATGAANRRARESSGRSDGTMKNPEASQTKGPFPLAHVPANGRLEQPNAAQNESVPMTARLAEAFREIIDSAIQREKDATCERLANEIKEQASKTQKESLENLRAEIAEQVNILQEQFLQQCRSRTEHMLAAIMKTNLSALSNQVDEMAAKSEHRIQEILNDLGDQLEKRSATALAEASSRLEQQLQSSVNIIHGRVITKLLGDIQEKLKQMTGHAEEQVVLTTDQNLEKLRGGLIRALHELTNEDGNSTIPKVRIG